MADPGSRVDLRGPAQWPQGIVFKQKKGVAQDPSLGSSTPGIWESLPLDAANLGGSLLPLEGNVESSQSLGVETLKTGGAFYLLFTLISNEGGSTEARILDAIYLPSQYALGPCSKNGQEDVLMFAVLSPEEFKFVERQGPSAMNDVKASLSRPSQVFRFDAKKLRMSSVPREGVTCQGFFL